MSYGGCSMHRSTFVFFNGPFILYIGLSMIRIGEPPQTFRKMRDQLWPMSPILHSINGTYGNETRKGRRSILNGASTPSRNVLR